MVPFGCEESAELEHQGVMIGDKTGYKLMSSLLHSSGSRLGTLEEVRSDPGNARYRIHTLAEVNNAGVDGQEEAEEQEGVAQFQMVVVASRTSGDVQSALDVVELAGLGVVYRRGHSLTLS